LQPGDTAAAGLYALNHASDVAQAGKAAPGIASPVQNLMVADRTGIALFVTGRVPVRASGDGSRAVPGADASHDWTGWASGEALPHYVAPASGHLLNANDRIAGPEFPVFLGRDWYDDDRARRIRTLLTAPGQRSAADFAAMQLDATSVPAQALLPALRAVAIPTGLARTAQALLAGWDGAMTVDAPQPLIFNAWVQRFNSRLLARIGVPPEAYAGIAPWPQIVRHALSPAGAHWCGGNCDALLADSLAAAVTDLAARFGGDPAQWRWGAAHQAGFAHPVLQLLPVLGPLAENRIATPGDDTTIDRGGVRGGSFQSVHGPELRGIYDLSDLDRSRFVMAPGQSGNPVSALASNFLQRWRDGGTVTIGPQPARIAVELSLTPAPQEPSR
jgi:penicillin G amidase